MDDIEKNVYSLKEQLSLIQSSMKGETLLVIPDHVDRLCNAQNSNDG